MTLSDKIVGGSDWIEQVKQGFIEVEDVKAFIKKIKSNIGGLISELELDIITRVINQEAGDKLI